MRTHTTNTGWEVVQGFDNVAGEDSDNYFPSPSTGSISLDEIAATEALYDWTKAHLSPLPLETRCSRPVFAVQLSGDHLSTSVQFSPQCSLIVSIDVEALAHSAQATQVIYPYVETVVSLVC
jgi:hypothetical protein